MADLANIRMQRTSQRMPRHITAHANQLAAEQCFLARHHSLRSPRLSSTHGFVWGAAGSWRREREGLQQNANHTRGAGGGSSLWCPENALRERGVVKDGGGVGHNENNTRRADGGGGGHGRVDGVNYPGTGAAERDTHH